MARPKKTTTKAKTARATRTPKATIEHINTMLNDLKNILDDYAQHLRSLDRRRLNGVSIKKMGFIRRTERGRGRACTDMVERVRTRSA